jgi:hypothetical protein
VSRSAAHPRCGGRATPGAHGYRRTLTRIQMIQRVTLGSTYADVLPAPCRAGADDERELEKGGRRAAPSPSASSSTSPQQRTAGDPNEESVVPYSMERMSPTANATACRAHSGSHAAPARRVPVGYRRRAGGSGASEWGSGSCRTTTQHGPWSCTEDFPGSHTLSFLARASFAGTAQPRCISRPVSARCTR